MPYSSYVSSTVLAGFILVDSCPMEIHLHQVSTWMLKCSLMKTSLSLLSPCILPPMLYLTFPSLPASSLPRRSHLFPLSRENHVSLFGPSLPSLSGTGDYSLVILYFTSNIHFWMSTYHVCLSGSGLPHLEWFFLSSIYLPFNFLATLFLTAE